MTARDVFLSHASADKDFVRIIARKLQAKGVSTFFDEDNVVPGTPFLDTLERELRNSAACAVFLGPGGLAPWHQEEVREAIHRQVIDRGFRVIPVLLPGALPEPRGQLPSFLGNRAWVQFMGPDDEQALHRLLCGIRNVEPGPHVFSDVVVANPYQGLHAFDVEDAPRFFGREVLVDDLIERLRPDRSSVGRFVGILGASGSGKSSVARAGFLAALKNGALPNSGAWPQIAVRPGADPLESLAIALARLHPAAVAPTELMRRFREHEAGFHREVRWILGRDDLRLVLLVDQAEEAFSLCHDEALRAAFFSALVYAGTVFSGQTIVAVAMRSDFYPRCATHAPLANILSERHVLVRPMEEPDLRRAIALPAQRSGRPLQPALVEQLLRDAQGQAGSLPLLEHALARLWEMPVREITLEEYGRLGGLASALNMRADAVFDALEKAEKNACRRLFLRLVQQGEGTADTKRRLHCSELPEDQESVSQKFAASGVHLLVWREGGWLEMAHEELLRRWQRLQQWIEEDRKGQRVHRRLTNAALEWKARAQAGAPGDEFLYGAFRIAEVVEWLASHPAPERALVLNELERQFIEASHRAANRERHAREEALQRELQHADEIAAKGHALQQAHAFRSRVANLAVPPDAKWVAGLRPTVRTVSAALTAFAIYVPTYFLLSGSMKGAGSLVTVPVMVSAWLLGSRGGFGAAVLALVLNVALYGGPGNIIRDGGLPGMLALLLIGYFIGHIRDLNVRLRIGLERLEALRRETERADFVRDRLLSK